ncbi:unnamed protein product [marine sediment metagenome]|uniref:Uncharacterized protein n=1 Tax=marine sediment metagenome TaxID=412755 RepID=X1EFM2_9ZZZZ
MRSSFQTQSPFTMARVTIGAFESGTKIFHSIPKSPHPSNLAASTKLKGIDWKKPDKRKTEKGMIKPAYTITTDG